MAELVALFKKRKRWEQVLFVAILALQVLEFYNVLVGLWLFGRGDFPLMNARGAALIVGLLLLRIALFMYLVRWHKAAFWILLGLTALAQLSGVVDIQDALSGILYAFLVFPWSMKKPVHHA